MAAHITSHLIPTGVSSQYMKGERSGTACARPVIGNMMQLRLAGGWAKQKSAHRFPRLEGTTGSIELGVFDESERDRAKVSQARSRVRTARPSWPLSARLLVGAMLVLNILLAAFLIRTEIKRPEARPGPPAASCPLTLERPKAGSPPQLNAPPDRGASLDLKTPRVEVRPAALPSTQRSKRPPIKALPKPLRASKTRRAVLSAPMRRAVVYPPQEPPGQTPTPVRDPAASLGASAPAASLGSSANVAPPGLAASFGMSGAGLPGKAAQRPNAPAGSGLTPSAVLAPSAIGHGLTAKGTRSGSTMKVASVGLPPVEKGLVIPKMPVGPISPKIEIVPRPAVKVTNCGDDKVFVACPVLHDRYETPYTTVDPEAP